MPSTYTARLRYEKQATGENDATWGDRLNTVLDLLDNSIAGMESIDCSGSSDITLTTANSATDQQRKAILQLTGTLTGNINIIAPDITTKVYVVHNQTTGAFTLGLKTVSGTPLLIPQGDSALVYTDGSDFYLVTPTLGTAATVDTGTAPGEVPLNSDLGTAAYLNTGTAAGELPLNSDLGSASLVDTGTGAAQVPLNSQLGSASLVNTGTAAGEVPLNSDLGTAAYLNTGTGASDIPTITIGDARYVPLGAPYQAADGTELAPSFSFTSDTNTGMFLAAVDTIGFSAGGTTRMSLSTTAATFAVAMRNVDGAQATPSYTFTNDPDTGMFSYAADGLGFAAGGSTRMYITSSGVFSQTDFRSGFGTAADPAFTFTSDNNTGMFRSGVDELGLATGGTARLTLSTTAATFAVAANTIDGAQTAPSYTFTNDPDTGMFSYAADGLGFAAGGATRMYITSSGVFSQTDFRTAFGTAADPAFTFTSDNNTGMFRRGIDAIGFSAGGVERMYLTTSGLTVNHPVTAESYRSGTVATGHSDSGAGIQLKTANTIDFLRVDTDVTAATWETIGPTGSGATNIWAELDDIPSGAKVVILSIDNRMTGNAATTQFSTISLASGDTISPDIADYERSRVHANNTPTGEDRSDSVEVMVHLDSSRRFKAYWDETAGAAATIIMTYRGFIS